MKPFEWIRWDQATPTDGVISRDVGYFPYSFALAVGKEQKDVFLKKIGCDNIPAPKSTSLATANNISGSWYGTLVTIHDATSISGFKIVEILIHEAVHVYQNLIKHIGESHPSTEFDAYTVHHISMELIADFERITGRELIRKGKP